LLLGCLLSLAGCGRRTLTAQRSPGAPSDGAVGADQEEGSEQEAGGGVDGGPDHPPAGMDPKAFGQACASARECASAFCVDGVCCNTPCAGPCLTCAAAGAAGTCTNQPAGARPRHADECVAAAPATCGLDGMCDGSGACRSQVAGTVCRGGSCLDAAIVGQFVCDGQGTCRPGPATVCIPFVCDPSTISCRVQCTTDNDCAGVPCVNGACGRSKRPLCVSDAECASGHCADGVCCNTACQGPCVACNLVGRTGTCSAVESGAPDPRAICHDEGVVSCGRTGLCDGFGGCLVYAAGTVCAPPTCAGGVLSLPRTCSGQGTCQPAVTLSCAPYGCSPSGARCSSGCPGGDAICVAGAYCSGDEMCLPRKAGGLPCAGDHECVSGLCRNDPDAGQATCAP